MAWTASRNPEIQAPWRSRLADWPESRVAIPTFSKRQAATLRKMIKHHAPGKTVGVVSSETTAELKTELADINTWVKNLDVLIYAPSMGSGVSIDLDGCDQRGRHR